MTAELGTLRGRLLSGSSVCGPFLKIPAAEVTELAAIAGFDMVVVDLEHSAFSLETATGMVRAAHARRISAVVRTAARSASDIARALDLGPDGVIIPGVASLSDAEEAVRWARYHPFGERGVDMYARAADWGGLPRGEYLRRANEEVLVGVMVEGATAMSSIESIAKISGLDLLFVGPYDLSQSLGMPGDVRHPEVVRLIRSAAEVAQGNGRVFGVYVDDVQTAREYQAAGVQFIGLANDADIFRRSLAELRSGLSGV